MAKHNTIGKIGEEIAKEFLLSKGLYFIEANYSRTYGEIDLIFKDRLNKLVFVEVKSVSWETTALGEGVVSHETPRPEENIHSKKVERLKRVIQVYLVSHGVTIPSCQVN